MRWFQFYPERDMRKAAAAGLVSVPESYIFRFYITEDSTMMCVFADRSEMAVDLGIGQLEAMLEAPGPLVQSWKWDVDGVPK